MVETEATPSWLNEKDPEEWRWAGNYLISRNGESERGKVSSLASLQFKVLVREIHDLESTVKGVKLVGRLRNAIRQRRYRQSEGGKETCSFTLPKETKATLKKLAKSNGTTETAIIRTLIEEASKSAQKHKAEKRDEVLVATITRNSSKLAQELNKIRIKETNRHLSKNLKRLAHWERYLGGELPEPTSDEEATITAVAEKWMREIQEAIRASLAKHEKNSPRSLANS